MSTITNKRKTHARNNDLTDDAELNEEMAKWETSSCVCLCISHCVVWVPAPRFVCSTSSVFIYVYARNTYTNNLIDFQVVHLLHPIHKREKNHFHTHAPNTHLTLHPNNNNNNSSYHSIKARMLCVIRVQSTRHLNIQYACTIHIHLSHRYSNIHGYVICGRILGQTDEMGDI